jgi:hypothetical protein
MAAATRTPFTVDTTYLLSDVSLYPCSFPVLIHEVTTGAIIDFSRNPNVDFAVHSTTRLTITNLDTGKTIQGFSPASTFYPNDYVVVVNPDGTTTVTFSDKIAGLNFQFKDGHRVTNLAGLSITTYRFVFGSDGALISFVVVSHNTPHQAHGSDTICALLAPA